MEQKKPNKFPIKIDKFFMCDKCNYKCFNKKDFNKHLMTSKHKKNTLELNGTDFVLKNPKKYQCKCGKQYKVKSGLWKHKQKCIQVNNSIPTQENLKEKPSLMDIITQNKEIMDTLVLQNEELMKKNNELTNAIQEMIPKIGNNNNNTINTINNHFSIQNFLN